MLSLETRVHTLPGRIMDMEGVGDPTVWNLTKGFGRLGRERQLVQGTT